MTNKFKVVISGEVNGEYVCASCYLDLEDETDLNMIFLERMYRELVEMAEEIEESHCDCCSKKNINNEIVTEPQTISTDSTTDSYFWSVTMR